MAEPKAPAVSEARVPNRWVILLASIISMIAVANYQYGWTFFVAPLQKQFHQTAAVIWVTFTVFMLLETWLGAFGGWFVCMFGPWLLGMVGCVIDGVGWIL